MKSFLGSMPNFAVQLATPYGDFVMARSDAHQPASILKTGLPHIAPEIEALIAIVETFPPKATVLDVGANIGLISIPIAKALADTGGVLVSFEPQRIIFYMLAANVVLNGLLNVHCHQLAVSDQEETLAFSSVDYNQAQDFGMIRMEPATSNSTFNENVRSVTIDMLELPRLDLIKIDVEEMELRVLAGAQETIARTRPLIWVEAWPGQRRGIFEFLRALGYELYIADELNFFCVPKERCEQGYKVDMLLFDGKYHPYS